MLATDNDGYMDIFFCGGRGTLRKNLLYRNQGDGTFVSALEESVITTTSAYSCSTVETTLCGNSVAWADFDTDGDMDLITSAAFFVNRGAGLGPDGQSLTFLGFDNQVKFYLSGPVYAYEFGAEVQPACFRACAWGDLDGDGDVRPPLSISRPPVHPCLLACLVLTRRRHRSIHSSAARPRDGRQ